MDDGDVAYDDRDNLALAGEYLRREAEFDDVTATRRVYAKSSDELIARMKKSWQRYCRVTCKDSTESLREFQTRVIATFLHWLLSSRKATLRKASTLQTYWNTLCLVRKAETGLHIISQDLKAAMVRQRLAQEFSLETGKAEKPIVRSEDEFELLKTIWSSATMKLKHERLRIQLALIAQLAGITGNRPGALLALRYANIKVTLLRDPNGSEWPKVLLEITFKVSKTYHGTKEPNTFPIPEVCSESCLSLCPQIMLLGLLFSDKAFAAPDLTTPEDLFRLRIPPKLNQLVLPIRKALAQLPVFQDTERTVNGWEMSSTKQMPSGTLRNYFAKWGQATGFELTLKPYAFRRGNGEALDSSTHISDAQRNVILQHASSRVFERNYLPRYITQDTQAAYRGLEPQVALTRLASGMTRTIDTRQPKNLDPKQLAQIDRHPEVQLFFRMRNGIRKRLRSKFGSVGNAEGSPAYEAYRKARRQYERVRKAHCRAEIKVVRATYREQQALSDIATQLGRPDKSQIVDPEGTSTDVFHCLSHERNAVLVALFSQPLSDPSAERQRRAQAIIAVAALSTRQEPGFSNSSRRRQKADQPLKPKTPACAPKTVWPMECRPTQCIFCLGNTALAEELRQKAFRDVYSLRDHFLRRHLDRLPSDTPMICPHPECSVEVQHKNHLRKHALEVHNTRT